MAEGADQSDAHAGAAPTSATKGGEKSPPTQELRIALAMRGGVSLAVWIGGAVAELDLLRRGILAAAASRAERPQDEIDAIFAGLRDGTAERARAETYRDEIGPEYTSVRIDVLAGASAGGLNAVLYGAAQTLGVGIEWMPATWRAQGDLWELMRPGWRPGQSYRIPSLLMGDLGFYPAVKRELIKNAQGGNAALVSGHVSIDLAATLEAAPSMRRAGLRSARPPEAHFHFRKFPRPAGTPSRDDMPSNVSDVQRVARLAYAARSTSSFPGAFEPALFHSRPSPIPAAQPEVDRQDAEETVPSGTPELPLNLYGVFSETTSETVDGAEPLLSVFDGGVFDNIPITRALDAIADMPADVKVERRLFYLDPNPPDTEQPPGVGEAPPRGDLSTFFVATALRALRLKQRMETADDDTATIRRELARVEEATRHRKAAFDHAGPVLGSGATAQLLTRYVKWRAGDDAERIVDEAVRPGLATLRFLSRPANTDVTLSERTAIGLRGYLREELDRVHRVATGVTTTGLTPVPVPVCASDARSLYLACGHLIAASQLQASRDRLVEEKQAWARRQRFQLIRAVAARFAEAADLEALRRGQTERFDAESMAAGYEDVAHAVVAPATPPADAMESPGGSKRGSGADFITALDWPSGEHQAALVAAAEFPGNPWAVDENTFWDGLLALPDDASFAPYRDDLWSLTAELARDLHHVLPGAGLEEAGVGPDKTAKRIVRVQELNAYLCDELGEADLQSLRSFDSITASAGSAAGTTYPHLRAAALRRSVEELVALPSRQLTQDRIGWQLGRSLFVAQSKLAGNQLGNFAGFLDASWRNHDFEWGRRDAAATILDVFLGQHPGNGGETPQQAQGDDPRPGPVTLKWSTATDIDRPRYGLGDLSRLRRFALASRAAQLFQRAVWPLTWTSGRTRADKAAFTTRQLLLSTVLLALRLPLSILPLVVAPFRLAAVVLLAAATVRFSPSTPGLVRGGEVGLPGSPAGALATGLAGVLVVTLVFRIGTVALRWRSLDAALAGVPAAAKWPREAVLRSVVSMAAVVGAAAIVVAGWTGVPGLSELTSGWESSTWFERAIVLTLVALAAWLVPATLAKASPPLGVALRWAIGLPALALALLLLLAWVPDPARDGPVWDWLSSSSTSLSVSAGVATLLVAAIVLGWTERLWAAAAIAVGFAAVLIANHLIAWLAEREVERFQVVIAALVFFPILIIALQVAGGLFATGLPAIPTAVGMLVAGTGAAVLGQLLFPPIAHLGVPFGLWQGVFIAATVTVYVQPVHGLKS